MEPQESVTEWLTHLKAGDPDAAEKIWERYVDRLTAMARRRMASAPRAVADEDDVVASAFESFFRRAADGKFPQLDDRDDLGKLLITITLRKAGWQANRAWKRNQGHASPVPIEEHSAFVRSPGFSAEVTDEMQRLFGMLHDPILKVIGLCKLEGLTNAVIATGLDCSVSTVERKLQIIRKTWKSEL